MGFSAPSNTLIVQAAAADPTGPIPAYLDSLRDFYVNSSSLLAWIQTVDAAGITSGRVHLGWRPQTRPNLLGVGGGPVCYLRWENFRAVNAGSPKTFSAQVDIVVDHVWASGANDRTADEFLEEMGFIDRIQNEVAGIGIPLNATFGGHIRNIDAPNSLLQDPDSPAVWSCEVRYTIQFGYDG